MKTESLQYIIITCVILLMTICVSAYSVNAEEERLARNLKRDYYLKQLRKDPAGDVSAKVKFLDSVYATGLVMPTELMQESTDIYISSGHYNKAIQILSDILNTSHSQDTLLYSLYNRAFCRQALGNYEMALDDIYKIKTQHLADSLQSYGIYSEFILARIYRVAGNHAKSDSLLSGIEERISKLKCDSVERYRLDYKLLLEKASASLDAGDYTKAMSSLKRASSFKMDKESASLVSMGLAELYHHIGEEEIAEDYYLTFIKESVPSINRLYALNNYCRFLVDECRYKEAVEFCKREIEYAEINDVRHVEASLYGILSEALAGLGDYKGAYDSHRRFYQLIDSVIYSTGPHLVNEYERKMDIYTNQMKTVGHTGERQVDWVCIMFGMLTVILILTVAALNFRMRKMKRMEYERCSHNEAGVYEDIAADTEEREREYLTLTLKLAEIGQRFEDVCSIAVDEDKSIKEKRQEVSVLRTSCGGNANFWDTFRITFEKLHPTFVARLRERHPDLSKGEMRMCSFIVMGLTTKDIASLTNRSVRTVESMKYRLNKKLQLSQEMTADSYLSSLK